MTFTTDLPTDTGTPLKSEKVGFIPVNMDSAVERWRHGVVPMIPCKLAWFLARLGLSTAVVYLVSKSVVMSCH